MLSISKHLSLFRLDNKMRHATDWKQFAIEHDSISGLEAWKYKEVSNSYDHLNIRTRIDMLRRLRQEKDDVGLLFALNEGIHGNQGGMGKPILYKLAKFGTKRLIEEYVDEIVNALEHISTLAESSDVSREDKQDFFERASHCFGRTALMLSGAGSLGHFHLGVIKTLFEYKMLPKVISGSSADVGSSNSMILGSMQSDLAIATRCCWPPDSSLGFLSA